MVSTSQFDSVEIENGAQGLCVRVQNSSAKALISLFGGQILSFIPNSDNRDRLWLSDKAIFDGRTAIRGGAPICWPWFGPHKNESSFPNHGFVRAQMWQLVKVNQRRNEKNMVEYTQCVLEPTQLGQFAVSKHCSLQLSICISQCCEIELLTVNKSDENMPLSQAIHSYFSVNDINDVSIKGINADYLDKLDNGRVKPSPTPYKIAEETDRVHGLEQGMKTQDLQVIQIIEVEQTRLTIEQSGHNATVVWNPWINKSAGMADMSPDAYTKMLCIEAATEPDISLAPGQQHLLSQRFY